MPDLTSSATASVNHYTRRATNYDTASDGWHVRLGLDFVKYLSPITPGSICLDLACGTGLVAIPLAEAAGPTGKVIRTDIMPTMLTVVVGKVIGVDVTPAMLDLARQKPMNANAAPITWHEGDITSLTTNAEIHAIVQNGGFDIITCCSALVLLPSPSHAITTWSALLKPHSGRLIIDVPTESKTLLHLFTQDLRAIATPTLKDDYSWKWIEGAHSLETMFRDAGLEVLETIETGGAKETVYKKEQVDEVFDEQLSRYTEFMTVSNVEELRGVFRKHWDESLRSDGTYVDKAMLYVTIGKKL